MPIFFIGLHNIYSHAASRLVNRKGYLCSVINYISENSGFNS